MRADNDLRAAVGKAGNDLFAFGIAAAALTEQQFCLNAKRGQ